MTVLTNLLIDNNNSQYTLRRSVESDFVTAAYAMRLSHYDLAVVRHLIDTYGVTYRGSAAVRDYLETRENRRKPHLQSRKGGKMDIARIEEVEE